MYPKMKAIDGSGELLPVKPRSRDSCQGHEIIDVENDDGTVWCKKAPRQFPIFNQLRSFKIPTTFLSHNKPDFGCLRTVHFMTRNFGRPSGSNHAASHYSRRNSMSVKCSLELTHLACKYALTGAPGASRSFPSRNRLPKHTEAAGSIAEFFEHLVRCTSGFLVHVVALRDISSRIIPLISFLMASRTVSGFRADSSRYKTAPQWQTRRIDGKISSTKLNGAGTQSWSRHQAKSVKTTNNSMIANNQSIGCDSSPPFSCTSVRPSFCGRVGKRHITAPFNPTDASSSLGEKTIEARNFVMKTMFQAALMKTFRRASLRNDNSWRAT